MAQRHSVDDYLETIWFLAFPIGEYRPSTTGTPTLASRVAEMLGVSRASAGEMLKRLEAEGLVERGEHKEAILTAAGRRAGGAGRPQAPDHRAAADRLHGLHGRRGARPRRRARRHVHRRHDRAHRREARPPRALPARLAGRHRVRAARRTASSLRSRRSRTGDRATIVRLAEHDGELLHWFYDQGLVPGTKLEVTLRAAGGRAVHGPAERRRARDRREAPPPGCSSGRRSPRG